MEELPIYLSSHPSSPSHPLHSADLNPSTSSSFPRDGHLSFPTSIRSLEIDTTALSTQRGNLARRGSFRPPLPPKPGKGTRRSSADSDLARAISKSLADAARDGEGLGVYGTDGGAGMMKSRSADSVLSAAESRSPPLRDSRSSSIASATSPTTWMNAMLGGDGAAESGGEEEDDMRYTTLRLGDGIGLGFPQQGAGTRTPGPVARSAAATPILSQGATLAFPARSREPPAVPPRPVTGGNSSSATPPLVQMERMTSPLTSFDRLTSPRAEELMETPVGPSGGKFEATPWDSPSQMAPPSPASAPPAMSPFATASTSGAFSPPPVPFTSHPPPPTRAYSPAPPSTSSHSTSSVPSASTALLGRLAPAASKVRLSDRLGAGVGFAREWGGKGRSKVQEQLRGFGGGHGTKAGETLPSSNGSSIPNSASSPSLDGPISRLPHSPSMPVSLHSYPSSSPAPTGAAAIKLPTTVLGVRVPNTRGLAFGVPLAPLVALTRTPSPPFHTPPSTDEVSGSDAREFLPGIAYRCLEYLSEWGPKEEGIYRIPGRSHMVNQLKVMYDAGVGQELDLRETHPAEMEPAAVASVFKSWLRELPESLLSPALEPLIDALSLQHLGFSASSASFLAAQTHSAALGQTPPVGMVDGRAPREYVETLREVFATRMEAEEWHLLRAIAYHLARLSSHAATNKMTITNLRLILSPTLRLTPGFVQILVVEREILFSKANESARKRQYEAAHQSTPPIPHSPGGAFVSSGRSSPNPQSRQRSPAPGSSPKFPSTGRWLAVDQPAHSPPLPSSSAASTSGRRSPLLSATSPALACASPDPLSPPPLSSSSSYTSFASSPSQQQPQRPSPQTPIAHRFASLSTHSSSSSSLPTRAMSNLSLHDAYSAGLPASSSPAPPPVAPKPPFIPTRDRANGAGGGGFFSGGGGGSGKGSRKGSFTEAESIAEEEGSKATVALDGVGNGSEEQERLADSLSSSSNVNADDAPPRLRQPRRSSSSASTSSVSSFASSSNGGTSRRRPTTMDLTVLPMPVGIGLGLPASAGSLGKAGGAGAEVEERKEGKEGEEEDAGWGLLSVEERKKFFGA